MGRDRQRIAAAVVVAGDRGDSDREGRRADFVLQPESDLVFAFANRRCHSEDVVSALNSGELDGEAGFGLACEEEVGRERSGLQVGLGAELGDRAGVQGQAGLVDGEGLAGRAGEVALAGDGNGDRASVDAILAVRNGVVRIGELAAVKHDSHFGGMGLGVVGHAGNILDHVVRDGSFRDLEVLSDLTGVIVLTGVDDGRRADIDVIFVCDGNIIDCKLCFGVLDGNALHAGRTCIGLVGRVIDRDRGCGNGLRVHNKFAGNVTDRVILNLIGVQNAGKLIIVDFAVLRVFCAYGVRVFRDLIVVHEALEFDGITSGRSSIAVGDGVMRNVGGQTLGGDGQLRGGRADVAGILPFCHRIGIAYRDGVFANILRCGRTVGDGAVGGHVFAVQ